MRVRARFSKLGKVSWTSHRDVARMWERALRRAGLPVAYTQGFSPRPRLSFGLALPTGHCSVAEYLDIDLNEEVASGYELARTLSQVLPTGVDVLGCAVVDAGRESLQSEVTSCTWTIEVVGMDPDTLAGVATSGMECETIPVTRERKGRQTTDDLRPAILALRKGGWDGPAGVFDDEESLLTVELETGQRGVRPFELLEGLSAACGNTLDAGRICRTHQWIDGDGTRREPIPYESTGLVRAPAGTQ